MQTDHGASPSGATVGAVEYVAGDVPMHYVEQGEGTPVLSCTVLGSTTVR